MEDRGLQVPGDPIPIRASTCYSCEVKGFPSGIVTASRGKISRIGSVIALMWKDSLVQALKPLKGKVFLLLGTKE